MMRDEAEKTAVKGLGELIGFGRIMQLCEELWREKQPGGELTVGTGAAFLVPCPHLDKNENGHCEWCCGAGRVTKFVLERQIESHGR